MTLPTSTLLAASLLASLGLLACGPPPATQTVTHSETATFNAEGVRTNTDIRQTDTRRADGTEIVQRTVVTNQVTPAPSARPVIAGQPGQPAQPAQSAPPTASR